MAFGRRQIVVSGCVAMCLYIWGVPSLIPLSLIHQQRYWPNLRGSLDHGGNRQQILVPENLLVLLVEKLSCFTGCSVILCTRHCDVIMSHWILSCVTKCWTIQLCVHWGSMMSCFTRCGTMSVFQWMLHDVIVLHWMIWHVSHDDPLPVFPRYKPDLTIEPNIDVILPYNTHLIVWFYKWRQSRVDSWIYFPVYKNHYSYVQIQKRHLYKSNANSMCPSNSIWFYIPTQRRREEDYRKISQKESYWTA